jgi:hypothetical protein
VRVPIVALTSAEVKFVDTSLRLMRTETLNPAVTDEDPNEAVGGVSSAGLIALLASEV